MELAIDLKPTPCHSFELKKTYPLSNDKAYHRKIDSKSVKHLSSVLKTGPGRPVRPVQSKIGYLAGSQLSQNPDLTKTGKTGQKPAKPVNRFYVKTRFTKIKKF